MAGARRRLQSPQAASADDSANYINIEIVREKLKGNQFRSMDDFSSEMQTLFSVWLAVNGIRHKYYKTF